MNPLPSLDPEAHEVTVDAWLWTRLLGQLQPLYDEARLTRDDDHLVLTTIDPAHVSMARARIPLLDHDGTPIDDDTTICLDIDSLWDPLVPYRKSTLKRQGVWTLTLETPDEDERTWERGTDHTPKVSIPLPNGGTQLRTQLDPVKTPDPSWVDNSGWPTVKASLPADHMQRQLRVMARACDHAALIATEDDVYLLSEGPMATTLWDPASTATVTDFTAGESDDEKHILDGEPAHRSLFNLDYLENILRGYDGPPQDVTVEFGTNYPALFKGRLHAEDRGSVHIECYQAPRIEN